MSGTVIAIVFGLMHRSVPPPVISFATNTMIDPEDIGGWVVFNSGNSASLDGPFYPFSCPRKMTVYASRLGRLAQAVSALESGEQPLRLDCVRLQRL